MPSGRYFGFVIGGALPAALAADWLTSTWDQNAGLVRRRAGRGGGRGGRRALADRAARPARRRVRRLRHRLPDGARDRLAAARHHVLAPPAGTSRRDGLQGAPPIRVLVGEERHVTVDRALRYSASAPARSSRVAADAQGRMRAGGAAGGSGRAATGPTIVCAQAGNVNTGAFDPLDEIADERGQRGLAARRRRLRALGGGSPALRHLVAGVERADSWATDATSGSTSPTTPASPSARTRRRTARRWPSAPATSSRRTSSDATRWTGTPSSRAGPAASRSTRPSARSAAAAIAEMVERCCAHARRFAELLGARADVEILNDVVLNQVLVRFGDDDATTRRRSSRASRRTATCWLGGTSGRGARRCASPSRTGRRRETTSTAAPPRSWRRPRPVSGSGALRGLQAWLGNSSRKGTSSAGRRNVRVSLLRVRRVVLNTCAMLQRRLGSWVEDDVWPDTVADREHERGLPWPRRESRAARQAGSGSSPTASVIPPDPQRVADTRRGAQESPLGSPRGDT